MVEKTNKTILEEKVKIDVKDGVTTLTHPTKGSFSYRIYDYRENKDFNFFYKQRIESGIDSTTAYSLAVSDLESQKRSWTPRSLHKISKEEKSLVPSWVKNKSFKTGTYFWRAPSFQYLKPNNVNIQLNDDRILDFEEYAIILLGNLKEGDRLPYKLVPTKLGHTVEYLIFEKYNHCFPSQDVFIHTESLCFKTQDDKKRVFRNLPQGYYFKSNFEFIQDLASLLSYWSMCRLNNRDSMFLDLFSIIKREHCFSISDNGGLCYRECFEDHEYIEKPNPIFSFQELLEYGTHNN